MADPSARPRPKPAAAGEPSGSRPGPSAIDAELALARLASFSSDVRGACVLDPDGAPLAASGDLERWGEVARNLLAAADAAAGEPVTQAHIGGDDGEVFAVRERGYALVAASKRFVLASLMLFDLRSLLRQMLAAGPSLLPAAAGSAGGGG